MNQLIDAVLYLTVILAVGAVITRLFIDSPIVIALHDGDLYQEGDA